MSIGKLDLRCNYYMHDYRADININTKVEFTLLVLYA